MKPAISCVVHTFNSELFLRVCLESIKWVDEIIVIDMHSTDRTVEIAKEFGAKVFLVAHEGYADPARKFGQANCTHEWILAIDSDEVVPPKLATQLTKIMREQTVDVVYLCFRNFFFGREIKFTSWGYRHIFVPRFYRRKFVSYGSDVHDFIKVSPDARILKLIQKNLAIIHFNYKSVRHFITKLNSYTDSEAKKEANNSIFIQFFVKGLYEFLGRYFLRQGYRDGWIGLYLSVAMLFYRWTTIAKKNTPSEEQVIKTYLELAETSLKGHET